MEQAFDLSNDDSPIIRMEIVISQWESVKNLSNTIMDLEPTVDCR